MDKNTGKQSEQYGSPVRKKHRKKKRSLLSYFGITKAQCIATLLFLIVAIVVAFSPMLVRWFRDIAARVPQSKESIALTKLIRSSDSTEYDYVTELLQENGYADLEAKEGFAYVLDVATGEVSDCRIETLGAFDPAVSDYDLTAGKAKIAFSEDGTLVSYLLGVPSSLKRDLYGIMTDNFPSFESEGIFLEFARWAYSSTLFVEQIATTEFAYYQGGEPAVTGDHAPVRTAILRKMDTDALSSAYREIALERAASFLSEAKQIVISRDVRSLDSTLFSRSAKLERFTLDENDLFSLESGALIQDGTCIAYPGASTERKVVLTQIDGIAEGAFRYARNIEELTLPFVGQSRGSSLAHMGLFGYIFGRSSTGILQQTGLSFAIPTSLRIVTITDETSIAPYAFAGCDFLKEIRLNEGIVAIGDYAFDRCHALETLEIPSTVAWMEMSEDYSCSRLYRIVCPEGLTLAYAERNFFSYHEDGKIIYQR